MSRYWDKTETSGRREEREKGKRDLGVQAVVVRQQTGELASLVQARPEQTGDLQKNPRRLDRVLLQASMCGWLRPCVRVRSRGNNTRAHNHTDA